ncbi:Zn-ribbon domain-containing OB-fold protein [Rhodococcoides kroppenstedtii]|uniref:Zn-ribbon domain-containing OB-fold protein n=1 Tax=Rhodococcoides kroppenstedtii TaxID=293050 RepID=UPI001C9B70B2|nr:OB-fold domain-containing protein [Rhodococcus kroppenstedtii]MBY6436863.1 OB-fold domain-containing protein [Rhodococcus kroppenstedtii]
MTTVGGSSAVNDIDTQTAVLRGSECTECKTVAFPASTLCSRCATPTARPVALSTSGEVWAYTVQRFPPKSPPYVPPADGFVPFAVGYVHLAEGIKIEAVLETDDVDALHGARVHLTATVPVPRFSVHRPTSNGADR